MTSNEILSMVFGEPIKKEEHVERRIETIVNNNNKSYIEKTTTSKIVTSTNERDLYERLSEANDIEKRAMYNVSTENKHFHKNHKHYEEHTKRRSRQNSQHDNDHSKINHIEHHHKYNHHNEYVKSPFEKNSPNDYHKTRTESLLSSASSEMFESVKSDFEKDHHQQIDHMSDRTLTDGERTPIVEDFRSIKSEITMIPRECVERNLKSPTSTRPSTVVGGYSTGQSHKIRDIVHQERVKELTEQLREELHFRNKYEKAYSEMSIEEELAHLPDEPEEDSESIASEFIENVTSGRHSAHFLTHSNMHSVDPLNVKLRTPLSTRPPSAISSVIPQTKKYEIKEYSLKKPIEPTPNPNPLTPYTIKPKITSGVQGKIQKKQTMQQKSSNQILRESINNNKDIIQITKTINNHADNKNAFIKRMDSVRISQRGTKNDKNYDFHIKNDKALICCDCGCHHVFTSGIPNLRFSVIKRVVGTESRRGSVVCPHNDLKKMSTTEKKCFNITTN